MKQVSGMMLALIMVLAIGSISFAQETPWFDMENCEICKPMAEAEGFMQNVIWETYPIANGMVGVTTVAKGYEEKFKTAHAGMMANWEKMQAGEKMTTCGMCQAFTAAMDETVSMETIPTMHGEIGLTTSTKPETIAKLQEIAKRNTKEMMAMMAAKAKGGMSGKGHEGQNH